MPSYVWRAEHNLDDANQDVPGYNYGHSGSELRLRADNDNNVRKVVGIRFIGVIPANTKSIPQATVSGLIATGTEIGANCDILLQKSLTTNQFKNSAGSGPDDVVSRPLTTTSISWVQTMSNNDSFTTPDLRPLFKELMELAGAVFGNPGEPYVATSPTAQDIQNPIVIFRGKLISPPDNEVRFYSYNSVSDPLTRTRIPKLTINIVLNDPILVPSDRRTHVAILSDSIGWALQPGQQYTDSLMSFAAFGAIQTTGMIKLEQPPGGIVSIVHNGQPYTIDDPYGAAGMGSITPEGRQGYTQYGILKDRLMHAFGVAETDIVIHAYGLGGTTAGPASRTQGVWSSSKPKEEPYDSLANIANPGGNLDGILTNPLWNYYDAGGQTLIDLLRDTSVERLLLIYIGGGNDAFATSYDSALLPMNATPADQALWDTTKATIKQAYKDIFNFCKDVRDAAGGSEIDFLLVGYPNFATDDPRIAPRVVQVDSAPGGTYHRGSWPSISNPDSWYGGSNGTDMGGSMAPYGSGNVNVIPHIPWFLAYTYFFNGGNHIAETNIPGVDMNAYGPLPRPMQKGDLGMFLQVKAFNFAYKTFDADYMGTEYERWYSHWAADHYGASFAGWTNQDKWNTAENFFRAAYNAYPYSSAANNNLLVSATNTKIAISYCTRNISNLTVNSMLHYTTGEASEEAIADLQAGGLQCQYVNLWDCLGSEVGSGVTASAGTWAFLDGVHLTKEASELYADEIIARARLSSPILQTLTDWSAEATSRFLQLFGEGV